MKAAFACLVVACALAAPCPAGPLDDYKSKVRQRLADINNDTAVLIAHANALHALEWLRRDEGCQLGDLAEISAGAGRAGRHRLNHALLDKAIACRAALLQQEAMLRSYAETADRTSARFTIEDGSGSLAKLRALVRTALERIAAARTAPDRIIAALAPYYAGECVLPDGFAGLAETARADAAQALERSDPYAARLVMGELAARTVFAETVASACVSRPFEEAARTLRAAAGDVSGLLAAKATGSLMDEACGKIAESPYWGSLCAHPVSSLAAEYAMHKALAELAGQSRRGHE